MKWIIVFLISLSFYSCGDLDLLAKKYSLTVRNNSEIKPLSFHIGDDQNSIIYPDTILPNIKVPLGTIPGEFVHSYSSIRWKDKLKTLPLDTLSIYFFDTQVIENEGWEVIRDEYKILQRYDLSIEDLNLLDLTVPYPPSEIMKDMKMYIPFDQN